MFSYSTKGEDYIFSFPKKRILDFYIKCVILVIIYWIFKGLIQFEFPTVDAILKSLFFFGDAINYGWYLTVTLILYIGFYLIFRFIKNEQAKLVVFGVFLLIHCVVFDFIKSYTWYQSVFAVLLGMLWLKYKQKIDCWLEKKYLICLVDSFIAFVVFFIAGRAYFLSEYIWLAFKMLSAVAFVCFVMVIVCKVPISNRITNILGKYSFEMYVSQGIAFELLRGDLIYIENSWLYMVLFIITVILSSAVIHYVFKIINIIRG